MADEPRRSGRATKGQHKNASSSPAPMPKPTKGAAAKQSKKAAASQEVKEEEEADDEDVIRCVCGDDNEADKRAFVSCDACSVWQHNICMGVPEDEDEVGEHYFCEECRPEEHEETVDSIKKGEKIWEVRNKMYLQEKKMSKSRKSKSGKPSWLKKDLRDPSAATEEVKNTPTPAPEAKETSSKRKRESEAPSAPSQETTEAPVEEKPAPGARQDKRRKSSVKAKIASEDPETAIVAIEKLPADRQKIAIAISKVIAESIAEQVKAGSYKIPDGQTGKALGDRYASKIEYALQMNHEGPGEKKYVAQFRALHANLKQNRTLLLELLSGSRSPDSMATMQTSDMASDKLVQERAAIKAEADRHATIDQKEAGPRYRRTHKGDELIEDESAATSSAPASRPVRHSIPDAEMAEMSPTREGAPGSPAQTPLTVDTKRPSVPDQERRPSSQQFDVNTIWAKTAQSPTQSNAPRPMQIPPRRRSSIHQYQGEGAKEDADVDRMLAEDDDDDNYAPAEPTGPDSIVWRGKLVQSSGDSEPTVNARFVAGRDVALTVPWKQMLPETLNIDGRLQIQKAEEYLCGLQWSSSSDVSVLAFTPYDDASAFTQFFEYFASRQRYAVVNKDKPSLVKDLYIIPIEPGGKIPDHIEMLEHCTIKRPVEERLLLATFVVARAANDTPTPTVPQSQPVSDPQATPSQPPQSTNGHHLPQHMRNSIAGPQGSPLQPQFSPAPNPSGGPGSPFPPNPYNAPPPPSANTPPHYPHQQGQSQQQQYYPPPHQQPAPYQPQHPNPPTYPAPQPAPAPIHNPLAAQILGDLQFTPSAQQVLSADPQIGEDKLHNLQRILASDEGARTDIAVLAQKLGASAGA